MVSSISCYVTGKTRWGGGREGSLVSSISCYVTGKTRWVKAVWSAVSVVTSLARLDGGRQFGQQYQLLRHW